MDWTQDMYISTTLTYFLEDVPHPFRSSVRIGPPDNMVTYHRMTGELFARLTMMLERMGDDDNVDGADYVNMITKFDEVREWVESRVPADRIAYWMDRVRGEWEQKRKEKEERDRYLGDI